MQTEDDNESGPSPVSLLIAFALIAISIVLICTG
ncbi:hypothetical protein OPIT5_25065 [Opitutaceae bacterium TAV5]|nr:hypothetical protein OPIT5_25065 [Opitutaceae bacterium TAV5]